MFYSSRSFHSHLSNHQPKCYHESTIKRRKAALPWPPLPSESSSWNCCACILNVLPEQVHRCRAVKLVPRTSARSSEGPVYSMVPAAGWQPRFNGMGVHCIGYCWSASLNQLKKRDYFFWFDTTAATNDPNEIIKINVSNTDIYRHPSFLNQELIRSFSALFPSIALQRSETESIAIISKMPD